MVSASRNVEATKYQQPLPTRQGLLTFWDSVEGVSTGA